MLELLVAGVRLLDGGRQRLELLTKSLTHDLAIGRAGRPETLDLRHHRRSVAVELSLDGRDESRSHVVQFGCHPLDPFRSQGSQRIIMTGSTQAMSYISVSGPPGLRMRRRNPPVVGRIGAIPPSSSVRPNCPHLLKILVRAPDTPPVATQPEVRSTCVAFLCHQNCSSPPCHCWWPSSALLALSIRGDLEDVAQARRGAQLGSTWEPLIASIQAIESEQRASDTDDAAAIVDARRATDSSMSDLRQVVRNIGDSNAMVVKIGTVTSALSTGRVAIDSGDDFQVIAAVRAYDTAERELIGLGRLLPAEAGDAELGRTLLAIASLAATEQTANDVVQSIGDWPASGDPAGVVQAALLGDAMVAFVDEFENVAPDSWLAEFREGRWSRRLNDSMNRLDGIVVAADRGAFVTFDATEFNETVAGIAGIRDQLAQRIVTDAEAEADALQQITFLRIGITLVALLLATLMALLLTRSITRRVRAVSDKAHEVATIQLPALVSALRDPRGQAVIPEVAPIEDAGTDELGELAGAFNVVQSTLVDVAHEQIEVLRRGVSDIFVTMARRTRSLIDRQLALLDELESDVDDPAVLANYYQLDHLATRMRRNSESLLVLASAESRRRRTKATDVDDVVRAAIGEVEDYRRIDVLNLDHLQVRGAVVADISHLLAELLDNASSFSPPESRVTISGRYAGEHYLITISDEGVGIGTDRLEQLNDLLEHPPIVGLSVEPTLGMSVVSLLAHKHGVQVRLVPSSPGLLVEVVLPATLYGPIDATGMLGTEPVSNGHVTVAPDTLVDWAEDPAFTDTFVPDVVSVEPHHITRADPQAGPTFRRRRRSHDVRHRCSTTPRRPSSRPTASADSAIVDAAPPVAEPTFEPEWSIEPEWSHTPERRSSRIRSPTRSPMSKHRPPSSSRRGSRLPSRTIA